MIILGNNSKTNNPIKIINLSITLSLIVLLSACAFRQKAPLTLGRVGPSPSEGASATERGYLIVYSDWAIDSRANRHSNYTIVSEKSGTEQRVVNSQGQYFEGPTRVELPIGFYKVIARAADYGKVVVPVHVSDGLATYVYLDGHTQPSKSLITEKNAVKLPNGNFLGWADTKGVN